MSKKPQERTTYTISTKESRKAGQHSVGKGKKKKTKKKGKGK
jgi:hypothetical protein